MVREGMFEERVARGIRLLDQVRPGWYNEISWADLYMEWPESCILGQLYGGYNDALRDLNLFGKADFYGFDLYLQEYESYESSRYFDELKAEWKRQATA